MIRRILFVLALLNIAGTATAYTIVVPDRHVVHVFLNSTKERDDQPTLCFVSLRGWDSPYPRPPYGPAIFNDGSFFIFDGQTVKLFSADFRLLASRRTTANPDRVTATGSQGLLYSVNSGPKIFTISGKTIGVEQEPDDWGNGKSGYLFLDHDYIVATNSPDVVWKIENGQAKVIDQGEWLSHSQFTIKNGAIFSDDTGYICDNASTFFRNSGLYDPRFQTQPDADRGQSDSIDYGIGRLFGVDSHANKYFNVAGERLLIAGIDGNILVVLKWRDGLDNDTNCSIPTVTQNGDIYYLESSKSGHKLIRIKNTWDPITMATLNDSQVRVRDDGSTTGTILGTLAKGDRVAILETSKDKQTIGGKTAPWYKVRLSDWSTGWIFGAFVNIDVVK